MKTLHDGAPQREMLTRMAALSPQDRPRWGSMSVHQMICHLADAYNFALGRREVAPAPLLLPPPVMKWMALRAPVPWPKGFRAPREIAQDREGTPPAGFEADRARLCASVEQFCSGLRQPFPRHPYFGTMSEQDWRRWGYLHADHHLRQFGR